MAITVTTDLPPITLSGNPMVLVANSDDFEYDLYTIFLYIFIKIGEDFVNIHTDSVQVDSEGNAQFDLSGIISRQSAPTLPNPIADLTIEKDESAVVIYKYALADGYGIPFTINEPEITSDELFAIPGGLADQVLEAIEAGDSTIASYLLDSGVILTNAPANKRVYPGQPEVIRFCNLTDVSLNIKLKVEQFLFSEADSIVTEILTAELDAYSLYSMNVTPAIAFELDDDCHRWEVFLTDDNNDDITERLSYVHPEFPAVQTKTIIFQNSLGGFDTVAAIGAMAQVADGQGIGGYRPLRTIMRNVLIPVQDRRTATNKFSGALGYFSHEEFQWLQEFFLSEQRFIEVDEQLLPITLLNSDMPNGTDEPPAELAIELSVGLAQRYYTKPR